MPQQLEKLKYLRIKREDGTISGVVPLTTDANNISMQNTNDLQSTIGSLNYLEEDDITTNIRRMKNSINNMESTIESFQESDIEVLSNLEIESLIANAEGGL